MFEFIRRHASVLAAALLAWMAWSDISAAENDKQAAGKSKLEGIDESYLVQRDPAAECLPLRDPCGIVVELDRRTDRPAPPSTGSRAAAPGAVSDGPAARPAADVLDDWLAALSTRGTSLAAGLSDWDPLGLRRLAVQPAVPPPPALPPARFSLYLDATLDLEGGGLARISGRTVAVGEALEGLDPHSPPVLQAVSGTTAVVAWRDELLVLDLLGNPFVHIGGPPVAERTGPSFAPPDPGGGSVPAAAAPSSSGSKKRVRRTNKDR